MLDLLLVAAIAVTPCPFARETPDEVLQRIEASYGPKESKYDDLLEVVRAAVAERLQSTPIATADVPLSEHPHVALVDSLGAAVQERVAGKRRKNADDVAAILERYPWHASVELARGLEHGSDRPVPANANGFIELDAPDGRIRGYPELAVNHHLWGVGEIVGWQSRQKKGRAKIDDRRAKDVVGIATALPSHEALRVLLIGNLPETPLYAIPELQLRIHRRLVERRAQAAGGRDPMDELLAMLDAKWNGFSYQPLFAKNRISFTVPMHALMSDPSCFPFQFANSAQMKAVGDLPFIAVQTYCEYADEFLDVEITPGDVIAKTGPAQVAIAKFDRGAVHLGRYKGLVDLFVRALLSPEIPLPEFLRTYDYPADKDHAPPVSREIDYAYDVPRRHVLLLWAACEKDPVRVADWLYDHVLSKDENAFPKDVSLVVPMMLASREQEAELLAAVVARIERDRAAGAAPGPFELEFSPFPTDSSGEPNSTALAHSYHAFHAQLSTAISDAARKAIEEQLD
ncbi:MAG: hypothetical protein AAF726_15005 [Planctomycetota bacterium]